ncbi:MAG: TniB family NTP-binding protein [Aquabacterium sp.]|uniref:TniB family NTP-binding protein n=1 Tax=Aquabacterium sp. TaxID=1872578 RepID=UPI002723711E|nr:TniB family NTP-binding protein [Aquabacterium sp.]MDO9006077.1 TniB family NTP-binding protein [Aquabacterium sp.]
MSTTRERNLTAEALAVMEGSDADRINYIRQDKFILYKAASEILADLKDLLTHPPRHRMPCRLIIAETNNGKTNLIRKFIELHPGDPNVDGECIKLPIIHVELVEPDDKHLYQQILKAVFADFPPKGNASERREQALTILKKIKPKLLIIDEANNIISGSVNKQRACLNAIKHISNEAGISVVATGTEAAVHGFRTDSQIENRFENRYLPKWNDGRDLISFLSTYEGNLPLKEKSRIWQDSMRSIILLRSEGTIGEIAKFLEAAAIYAIRNKIEQITPEVLNACGYVSPKARRMGTQLR